MPKICEKKMPLLSNL